MGKDSPVELSVFKLFTAALLQWDFSWLANHFPQDLHSEVTAFKMEMKEM
jgi:hypothetical protein